MRFIFILCLVLSQLTLFSQNARLFIPHPNEGDTTYLYEISNPHLIRFKMFEVPPAYYADETITPCYISNYSYRKGERLIWVRGLSKFYFDASQPRLKFLKAAMPDPFMGDKSELTIEGETVVFNDISSIKSFSDDRYKAYIKIRATDLHKGVKKILTNKKIQDLRITLDYQNKIERFGTYKWATPLESNNCMSLKITRNLTPQIFEVKINGEWKGVTVAQETALMKLYRPQEMVWIQFVDNRMKREAGTIALNPKDDTDYIGGYFIHRAAADRLQACNFKSGGIYVFPNPSFGDFHIRMYSYPSGDYTLKVYNIIGRQLKSVPFTTNGETNIPIDLGPMQKGTYIYSIENEDGVKLQTKRLLIMGL